MSLVMGPSPHIKSPQTISSIMLSFIKALLPACFMACFFFGLPAFILIFFSIFFAVFVEGFINVCKKEPLTVFDGSAALSGLLLALMLPPNFPLWMLFLGNLVAIGLVKHAFGGLGKNIFNSAMAGKLFLAISYPSYTSNWHKSGSFFHFLNVPSALPLAKDTKIIVTHTQLFWGNVAGNIGETSTIALIIGAIILFRSNIIDWKVPASFLATIFVLSVVTFNDPFLHIMAGSSMLGAFFIFTDYSTTPITKIGRLLFGICAGILVMSTRLFTNIPESLAFATILSNSLVPLLDKIGLYLHLRVYERLFAETV